MDLTEFKVFNKWLFITKPCQDKLVPTMATLHHFDRAEDE